MTLCCAWAESLITSRIGTITIAAVALPMIVSSLLYTRGHDLHPSWPTLTRSSRGSAATPMEKISGLGYLEVTWKLPGGYLGRP
jgi:hypothetical protein